MANHRKLIDFIRGYEGGLSKALTDNARKDPVPDGSGYHTNQGITWATFRYMAKACGYTATPALFYQMPLDIWTKIYKAGFWDGIKGDLISVQGIADYLVDFAWASGPVTAGKYLRLALLDLGFAKVDPVPARVITPDLVRNYINKANPAALLAALDKRRRAFVEAIPGTVNDKGWFRRITDLYQGATKNLAALPLPA